MHSRNVAYLERLDHLRFLAASLVILFHAQLLGGGGRAADYLAISMIDQGHVGVHLFMVISGFILAHISADKTIDTAGFYKNRVLRIYPLFILVVTVGYFSTSDPRASSAGIDYLMSLLPISNLYRLNYGAYGGQLWTVAVELQFYLLFPFLLAFRRRYGMRYLFCVVTAAFVLRCAQYLHAGTVHHFAYFTLFGSIDLFIGGMIAAELFEAMQQRKIRLNIMWSLGIFLVIGGLVALLFAHRSFFQVDYSRLTNDGISRSALWVLWPTIEAVLWSSFLLIYLGATQSIPASAFIARLGKYSYSMYAWHILVIEVTKGRFPWLSPYVFGTLVVLPLTALVSWWSYALVEAPFLALRSRYARENARSDAPRT